MGLQPPPPWAKTTRSRSSDPAQQLPSTADDRQKPDALPFPARLGRDCGLPAVRAIPDAGRRRRRLLQAAAVSPADQPRPGAQVSRREGHNLAGSRPPRWRRRLAAPCPLLPLRVRVQASR